MRKIRAVFWDIDGTMVTSEPVHDMKIRHVANSHAIYLSEDVISSFHGQGDIKVYEVMSGLGMLGTMPEFFAACDEYYFKNIHLIDTREGFGEAFVYFEELGIPQAAVSNATLGMVTANLARTGIADKLIAQVDLDGVVAKNLSGKPAPDPYLEGLRIVREVTGLNILPGECLVIEDSPTGVQAGKAAGMTTIFWKLAPERTLEIADYEAYTGTELMEIVHRLTA